MKPETLDTVRRHLTEQLATVEKVHGTNRKCALTPVDIETICELLSAEPLRPDEVRVRVHAFGGFAATRSGTVPADRALVEVVRDLTTMEEKVDRLYVARYATPCVEKTSNIARIQVHALTPTNTFGRRGGCAS